VKTDVQAGHGREHDPDAPGEYLNGADHAGRLYVLEQRPGAVPDDLRRAEKELRQEEAGHV